MKRGWAWRTLTFSTIGYHVLRLRAFAHPDLSFAESNPYLITEPYPPFPDLLSLAMAQPECDWLIVGGGVIGTAIANSLGRKGQGRIIWYTGKPPVIRPTASWDESKIVRTRYPVPGYTLWAESALSKWRGDKLYRNFFHEPGWIRVVDRGSRDNDGEISSKDMRQKVGSDQEPYLKSNEILRFNKSIGSVDFDAALDAAAKQASVLGVERREKDITKLVVQDGICVGVDVAGEIVKAKKIIVAAGPWTPGLLEKSGVGFPDNFFKVVAVSVATMRLTNKELEELHDMPIIVTDEGASKSVQHHITNM